MLERAIRRTVILLLKGQFIKCTADVEYFLYQTNPRQTPEMYSLFAKQYRQWRPLNVIRKYNIPILIGAELCTWKSEKKTLKGNGSSTVLQHVNPTTIFIFSLFLHFAFQFVCLELSTYFYFVFD